MTKKMLIAATLIAVGLAPAALGNAYAAGDNTQHDRAEAQALLSAKISAMDAAAAAVKAVPGKVAEIGFDAEKSGVTYEITVVAADGSEHDLMVNGNTGDVTKMALTHDNEGGQSEDGEDGEDADHD